MNGRNSAVARTEKWKMGRWEWFHFAQSRKTSINGPVLMQKAEEITKQLDHDEFESPDGSFNCWKKNHDLC